MKAELEFLHFILEQSVFNLDALVIAHPIWHYKLPKSDSNMIKKPQLTL